MSKFTPRAAASVTLSVTTSTDRVKIADDKGELDVLVHNAGSVIAFVTFGTATVEAVAATGQAIPAGATFPLRVPPLGSAAYIAAITASGTATLHITPGSMS